MAVVAWTTASAEQGRGLGPEAAVAMAGWLAGGSGVGGIDAHIRPEHSASAAVARHVGGLLPTDAEVDGETGWSRSVE